MKKISQSAINAIVASHPLVAEFRRQRFFRSIKRAKHGKPVSSEVSLATAKTIAKIKSETGLGFREVEAVCGLKNASGMTAYRIINRALLNEKEPVQEVQSPEPPILIESMELVSA